MALHEFFHRRREAATLSPQELLDTSFILFQEGRKKVGVYFSRRWSLSIEENVEDASLVIKKSKKDSSQHTGELVVISPSPADLSYYRFVNGKMADELRNTRDTVKKIRGLLGQVTLV